jgi:hypothetical protein
MTEHMSLEHDTRELTAAERIALRKGLRTLSPLVSRLYGDLPRLSRSETAADLNRMTGIIREMRSTLLEFPDKPPQPEPWDLASRASWFHTPRDVDDLIDHAARDHDAWAIYAAWHAQADRPALMKTEQVRRSIAGYISEAAKRS